MKKRTKKNIIAALGIATGAVGGASIAAGIVTYDKIFPRHKRPDYSITPGLLNYEQIKDNYPRFLITFPSNDELLQGYYYKTLNPKGLVIICHGMRSGADDYLSQCIYFIDNGYNVFSFDYTGTFSSSGDSTIGMCQPVIDLHNALVFLENNDEFKHQKLLLFGHSWGGYAACSIMCENHNILAVASISAMNDASSLMFEKGKKYAGNIAYSQKPFLDVYQRYLFKQYFDYNSIKGINNTNIPFLIAHGVNDKIIGFDEQSIIAKKTQITNDNVNYYIAKGFQGEHCSILYSIEALNYQEIVKSDLTMLKNKTKEKLSKEQLQSFYKNVDNYKYSELNASLMEKIITLFDAACKDKKNLTN